MCRIVSDDQQRFAGLHIAHGFAHHHYRLRAAEALASRCGLEWKTDRSWCSRSDKNGCSLRPVASNANQVNSCVKQPLHCPAKESSIMLRFLLLGSLPPQRIKGRNMTPFSESQRVKRCSGFRFSSAGDHLHSNYLVQLPVPSLVSATAWDVQLPVYFLATDLTVRILAHRWLAALFLRSCRPALFVSYVISPVLHGEAGRALRRGPLTCLLPESLLQASWPMRWGRSSTCAYLTACVRITAGGWPYRLDAVRQRQRYMAFFFIAFWHSPDAFM